MNNDTKIEENSKDACSSYDTLVLSGASQQGIFILGALQYTTDNFLIKDINTYIGTSAGAMISYLLIIGYTPIDILVHICSNQMLEKMQEFNIVELIHGNGASSFNSIQENLEKMTITKLGYLPTLQNLKDSYGKTLICVTYNLNKNKTEYLSYENFSTLPCLIAIRMSCNLPLIFDKYKYGSDFYIDGGISDNFPIQLGDEIGNKILGLTVYKEIKNDYDPNMDILDYIYKLLFIPINQSTLYKCNKVSDKCTIVKIVPNNKKFFDFNLNTKDKMEMFCNGYTQISEFFS